MFDLLAVATLTTAACAVIGTYTFAFGETHREQALVGAAMSVWFGLVLWLGATDVLRTALFLGFPGLAWAVAIPRTGLTTLLLSTLAGRRRALAAPLPALIAVQALRILGVWFILLYSAHRLPAPFAPVAGWGDILAGVLAVPLTLVLLRAQQSKRRLVLIWNVIGAGDLIAAVSLGLMSLPGPVRLLMDEPGSGAMNALPWFVIPGFLVPSLLTLHVVVFYRLFRKQA